uniref:Uncharacterized protein n=1 Tax=Craspedostauros australis TaxID=1486917 RepID=A0A7R9ZMY2_9STRA|mmetsp:Transcript_1838/g.5053  ORF Transcript_1838/g.5053 Transcript_1838/m.5053 type:complete len:156 (+) Transcript_1838:224-691(+)
MKTTAILTVGLVASAQAFAPMQSGRVNTELSESLFDRIFGMDLFAPNKEQNDYGARGSKNLKVGKIGSGSYVPAGMDADKYNKIRATEAAKKKANYERNVKKAGIFEDYTEWYTKRGTDTKQNWAKDVNKGHRMAKTKFDWSGKADAPEYRGKAK